MRLAPLSERLYILQLHCGHCTIQWNQSNAIYVCSLSHGHYTLGVDDRRIDLRMLLQSLISLASFIQIECCALSITDIQLLDGHPIDHTVRREQLLIRRLVMTNRRHTPRKECAHGPREDKASAMHTDS